MKKNCIATVIAIITCIHSTQAQNTLLVYTKFPTHINFVDESDKPIQTHSIWNQSKGGFMINYDNLENTYVVADELVNFKLSNQSRLTKLIALDSQNKMSLYKCFTSEKYCCEKLTDKQKKGTEKLLAVSVMKKSATKNAPLIFSDTSLDQIYTAKELSISWATEKDITDIYLVDITELKTIWQSKVFTSSALKATDLSAQNINLKKGHTYQLNIQLQTPNPEAGKFSFEFEYRNVAFNCNNYLFATKDAILIGWRTDGSIAQLSLSDESGSELFQQNNYSKQSFDISELPDIAQNKISAGKEYSLKLTMADHSIQEYQFMVLLNEEDSQELKALLEY